MSILSGKAGLLLTIIAAGYLLKRTHILKTEDAKVLSRVMIYLTLPAALISGFRNFSFQAGLLLLAALALACNLILLGLGLLLTRGKPFTGYNCPVIISGRLSCPLFRTSCLRRDWWEPLCSMPETAR